MALLQCGIVLAAVSSVLAPSHDPGVLHRRVGSERPAAVYASSQQEFYLTAQQIAYIRPGLHITIKSVTIGADNKPVVQLSFADDAGQPLDRAGVLTPGPLSISFILAWYDPDNINYTDYSTRVQTSPITGVSAAQASTDSGGKWQDTALGEATYTFGKALPADYDKTKTHTLGIYATRNIDLTDPIVISKTYVDDETYNFRPDGQPVTDVWDATTFATCNQCHDPLAAHGETGRQDPRICVLCHNDTQSLDPDTGNVVNFKVMIHKIHMGENLPSVKAGHPYEIIGFNQGVNDFSTVAFPQDIRNCTTCHKSPDPAGKVVSQAHIWYTKPNRAACGSCHDDVNFATGENHPPGPLFDDDACAACHVPQGESEFDASIIGAHTIETKSKQLKGLNLEIESVTNTAPGDKPTVIYKLTNNDGSVVDPNTLGSFNFRLGGPTAEYTTNLSESPKGASTASGDAWVFTFQKAAIPADATGSWVLTADAYRNVTIDNHTDTGYSVREAAKNPIFYFPVTDAQAMPRRTVVDINKCNVCHDVLALHGGQRFKVQECVVCHNPNANDSSQRPAAQAPPETIHFKYMIHRIHTGENMTLPFTIYGFGGSVNNFNEVRFPGDRRDCLKCHATVSGQQTYELPLPDSALPTPTLRNPYIQLMQPTTAACLSCHDERPAAAHAFTMTTAFGEACEVCHGTDGDFAVARVHAR
jgi:OmcA/MtrC family decaheme c-type cytochrome